MAECKGCFRRNENLNKLGYCANCSIAGIQFGYTRQDLNEAFNVVKNPQNYKKRIDAYCHAEQVDVVDVAVSFFTGSAATFYRVGNTEFYHVTAPGYYVAVGA